jgi:hypothetical protein
MSLYERVAGLALSVDRYRLERRSVAVSSGWQRVTTTVVVSGDGLAGRGEDVTYDAAAHDLFAAETPVGLAGRGSFDEISSRLATITGYRRWAFESALLSLALGQAGRSLAELVDRDYQPARFVVSTRGDALAWHAADAALEFKLDAEPEWTDDYIDALAKSDRVRVLDLKAYYPSDSGVAAGPSERLYRACVERFDERTTIEDPWLADGFGELFRGHERRLSFDAPIHSVADIESLPVRPGRMNIKPSRFGRVETLLATLEYCAAHTIAMYGGGQFELGVGRDQIQELASLFYPDAPNDIAPAVYNTSDPRRGLPTSPLSGVRGFTATR